MVGPEVPAQVAKTELHVNNAQPCAHLSLSPPPLTEDSPMASVHRGLSDVHDVLYIIFRYLDPGLQETDSHGGDSAQARWTLANIAISCKAFSDHALDVLWESLPSDAPLLRLLEILGLIHDDHESSLHSMQSAEYVCARSLLPRDYENSCNVFHRHIAN